MGVDFPSPIRAYFDRHLIGQRYPAYLEIDADESLRGWGGALQYYGIERLELGQDVVDQIPFLMGMLPVDESGFILPWMEMGSGRYADVHLLSAKGGTSIVLLDATFEATQHRVMQQKINDINLHLESTEPLAAPCLRRGNEG